MGRPKQTKGTCTYCGKTYAKGGMVRHLQACKAREEAMAAAEKRKSAKNETLYHLRVEDAWSGRFWLDLEVRGKAKLKDIDHYLRRIWLECCGHMSQFSIGGWSGDEISFSRSVAAEFEPDVTLTHIYDFGSSSETLVRYMGQREGVPLTKRPMVLMARNDKPVDWICMKCDQEAEWLCMECVYEDEKSGLLCEKHAETHPHENYGEPHELVNSPRVGVCGPLDGVGEPPY